MICTFSPCRRYRYDLWRQWTDLLAENQDGYVAFIGLNPSTADESRDDPTVRRCLGFTKAWGYRRMCMLNLFAFRATDPAVMKAEPDPAGPENVAMLVRRASEASLVIAAWGCHGAWLGQDQKIIELLPMLCCLKRTKHGHPQHPLYLPRGLQPQPFLT